MISPAGNLHDGTFTGEFVDDMYNLRYRMDQVKLMVDLFTYDSTEYLQEREKLDDERLIMSQKYNIMVCINLKEFSIKLRDKDTNIIQMPEISEINLELKRDVIAGDKIRRYYVSQHELNFKTMTEQEKLNHSINRLQNAKKLSPKNKMILEYKLKYGVKWHDEFKKSSFCE
jgi:hypothetical protein